MSYKKNEGDRRIIFKSVTSIKNVEATVTYTIEQEKIQNLITSCPNTTQFLLRNICFQWIDKPLFHCLWNIYIYLYFLKITFARNRCINFIF